MLSQPRYQLFRLLGEPQRLRLLGLAAIDELSVGELAELLQESQPNVSKHVHLLRQAGLLLDRHQGTRVYVRLSDGAREDAVVSDAISEGQRLCGDTATREHVAEIIASRDQRSRAYFAAQAIGESDIDTTPHVPVYAMALALMRPTTGMALDAGTGDGGLLDLLAPSYGSVVAVDRSPAQLAKASARVTRRGFTKVRLECTDVEGDDLRTSEGETVNAIFASRMLHHTANPRVMLQSFASLLAPQGRVCIIDYVTHDDERMREQRADVWMGFDEAELRGLLRQAGFARIEFRAVPNGYISPGFDAHIPWFVAIAQRP
jgi:ArsR family transcriptional regulator